METEVLQFSLEDDYYSFQLSPTPDEHEILMERSGDSINIIENDYDVDTSQPITFNYFQNDNQYMNIDLSVMNSAAMQRSTPDNFSDWYNYIKTANFDNTNMDFHKILQHEEETENFSQEVMNLRPELKLEEDGQRTEESTFNMTHDTMNVESMYVKTEKEIINDILSELFQETHELEKESANTANKNRNLKGKRKRKTNEVIKDKQEDQEDCIDIETISDEIPVLQAGNIKSLLEQFEASENPRKKPHNKSTIKNDFLPAMKSNTMQQMTQKYQNQVLEKLSSQISNQHKRKPDYVSKEVIDRIKASGRKRAIAIIPAMPNVQNKSHSSNNTQEVGATFSHNKVLKQVTSDAKTKVDDISVQLDHDYCIGSATKSCDGSKFTKRTSVLKLNQNKKMLKCNDKIVKCHNNSNLKKDSVEVTDICDTSKLAVCTSLQTDKETDKINENRLEKGHKDYQQKICVEQSHLLKDSLAIKLAKNNVIIPNKSSNTDSPVYIIHSALAKSILRNDSKNTLQASSKTQMISVLKKPPPNASQSLNKSQSSFLKSNSDENTVTTATNSLNNKVENIILQDTKDLPSDEQMKKPPFRKKLNLAEYRNRRDQNRSDNSRTNSPIQPTMLVYVHHASTTTEPIKNDPENPSWCEREIVSILKPKSDIDEEKNKPKPLMCDVGIQTYETVFEFSGRSLVDTAEKNDTREENMKDIKQKSYKKDRFYRRSSRSRSKSKSKKRNNSESSRSRSRSRNGDRSRSKSRNSNSSSRSRSKSCSRNRSRSISKRKNHCRSRSRSCRCSRRRRIRSRRRSSVSSTSSCSSHSRSYTTSTRSRYSRSRSRSSRSRSEYSSCSRSSSYSNYGRSRWSNHQRKSSSDRERSYDRYKRHSYGSHRYKNWRSPVRSYYKSYNWCNREKQRQVEERRVIYVGRLDENTTNADLQKRFENFGPVVNVSIHLREHGDNYGFVTFKYKDDAYTAIEHGNDNPSLPTYDLSFGGRRAFCKYKYSDLDDTVSRSPISSKSSPINEENTFDFLLEEAKAKLRKRKV